MGQVSASSTVLIGRCSQVADTGLRRCASRSRCVARSSTLGSRAPVPGSGRFELGARPDPRALAPASSHFHVYLRPAWSLRSGVEGGQL